ncbi:MAG: RidA family protein [Acidobacteriota bacterium]
MREIPAFVTRSASRKAMLQGLAICAVVILLAAAVPGFQGRQEIIRVGPDLNLPFSPGVKAGGFIYLSGALATDSSGGLVQGDIRVQTRQVLDNLSQVIAAAGSSMENVATVNVFLKHASDFAAMNEVYRGYWPKDPPARTTVVANLVLPEALIEVSAIAIPTGGERRVVHPPDWARSASPYSYGILSGETLFLAGLVSRKGQDNSIVEGDIGVQTRTTMENAGQVLQAAGMSYADVVSSRIFITDVADFQSMNEAYRSYFAKDPPARATVRAGLMAPQYRVEITMTAVKGSSRQALVAPNADGTPGRPNPNLSSAVRAGNRLFLSGMLGNVQGNETDMKAQTRETLARIERTLRAAGYGWENVVDAVVYITDVGKFADMNAAYREVFRSDFPARATVETGLVSPTGLVEIMMTAVK